MRRSHLLVKTLAVALLTFLSSAILTHAQDASQGTPKELVFSAAPGAKGTLYKVDNTTVSDPLRGLGKAIEKYGADLPVICLIDSRLPIRMIGDTAALAGKAGFKYVRTFVVDHRSGKVSEVKQGPWMSVPN
jgi:hypothetical protein